MNKIFNWTALLLATGTLMDILIGVWIFKVFDVIPDGVENWVISLIK